MRKRLFHSLILAFISLNVNAQTELITNGNFSNSSGWATSGNWYVSPAFSCYHSSGGYAYAGNSSGQAVINETGDLKQTITIPSTATSATFSFYVSVNTDEVAVSSVYDYVNGYLLNSSGAQLTQFTPTNVDNLHAGSPVTGCTAYSQKSFSIPSTYFGQTMQIDFQVHSDVGPKNTMFRIDDVSLTYTSSTACAYSINPANVSPSSSSGSGSFSVTASLGCNWTSVSNNTSWLTITSGSSGTGNGTVGYSYTSNPSSSPRTGTITIENKTFTVTQAGTTTNNLLYGVDISHYNNEYGTVSWSTVYASGKSFSYVQATQGVNYNDAYFTTNMTSSNPNGVVLGAYHLGRPDFSTNNTAANDANHFLTIAVNYTRSGFLPPALDMEPAYIDAYIAKGNSYNLLAQWINSWCSQVQTSSGKWPILYVTKCYAANLRPYYQNGTINSNIKIWIATNNISSEPPGSPGTTACGGTWAGWPWIFHQYFAPDYAGNNPIPNSDPNTGKTTGMDLDIFNGDLTAFNNLIGGGSSQTAIITNFTISSSNVCPSGSFTITNTINASVAINNVILGALIAPTGTTIYIDNTPNDKPVSLPSGTSNQTRNFKIPQGTASGSYDVVSGLWQDVNNNGIIDPNTDIYLNSSPKVGLLTIPNSCTGGSPPNDICTNATPLTVNTLCSVDKPIFNKCK